LNKRHSDADSRRFGFKAFLFVVTAFMGLRAQKPDESGHNELEAALSGKFHGDSSLRRSRFILTARAGIAERSSSMTEILREICQKLELQLGV